MDGNSQVNQPSKNNPLFNPQEFNLAQLIRDSDKSAITLDPNNKQPKFISGRNNCNLCSKELCNKYFMKSHLLNMHNIEIDERPDEAPANVDRVTCDLCKKGFCSKYFLKVHKKNLHGVFEESGVPVTNQQVSTSFRQVNEIKKIGVQFEDMQIVELNENGSSSGDQISHLKTRLLHHLVEVCRVMKNKENNDLLKANNELINELLLSSPTKPVATKPVASESANALKNATVAWNEFLVQKLIAAQMHPTDVKVKKLVDQQVETASKLVDDVLDSLVFNDPSFLLRAASVARFEGKLAFELEPWLSAESEKTSSFTDGKSMYTGSTYLHGLAFEVELYSYSAMLNLFISCKEVPANKACKVRIEVKIKNQADQEDWVWCFGKVFCNSARSFYINKPVTRYTDESLGFLRNGKVAFEVAIRMDELVEHHSDGCTQTETGHCASE